MIWNKDIKLGNFKEIICPSPDMIEISLTLWLKERYLEMFMLLYLLDVCQKGGIWIISVSGIRFLTRDMEDRVILDFMDDVFYTKEDTLKVSCWYLYGKCVRKWRSRRDRGYSWFLFGDMEERVILDVMTDVFLP